MIEDNDLISQSSTMYQCDNCQSSNATLWCEFCSNNYCETCSLDIHRHKAFSDHRLMSIDEKPCQSFLCAQCSKKELNFFCYDCVLIICGDCLLSTHNNHHFIIVDAESKDIVLKTISNGKSSKSILNENFDQQLKQIDTIGNINRKKIEEIFLNLRKLLDEYEHRLQEKISIIERKNKNLIENYQRQIVSSKELNLNKIFAMYFSTNKQEFNKNFHQTMNEIHYLQPSIRILYKIEGLNHFETIERTIKQIRIVEEELQSNKISKDRNLKLERFLFDKINSEKLLLRNQQLNNQDMIILANLLRESTTLTNLNLSTNQIESIGIHSLSTALMLNTTLISLNLSENSIGNQGVHYLADMLICENTTLTKLYLDNTQIDTRAAQYLANALKINQTLLILRLADNTIGDEGIQYLSDALKINQTLTVLNISGNCISSKGMKYLAQTLLINKTLTKLFLSRNMIQDEGIIHLANAFKQETVLNALFIAANGITERGARYLMDSLQSNVTLSTIDYEFNEIGDELYRYMHETLLIIDACRRNKEMESIRLIRKRNQNQKITTE